MSISEKAQIIVSDMTCGHCVSTIEKSMQAAFPASETKIDLASRTVITDAPVTQALSVIEDAGYTPVLKVE